MKTRIISAIIMLLIVVPIVWYGGSAFKIGLGIVGILALKELLDLKKSHQEIPIFVTLVSIIDLLLLIYADFDGYSMMFGLTYRGLAITILTLLGLSLAYKEKYKTTDALFLIASTLLIGTSFNAMILIRALSLTEFCLLILIFILTDTFALFGGLAFGHHKLIPSVSPGKTIEGSITGTFVATIGASVYYHFLINPINIKAVLGIIILSIIGQIGDLIFSKIKRENDIKDFSNLIPGHGGILDRLDSTIAIMLGYLIIYNLF